MKREQQTQKRNRKIKTDKNTDKKVERGTKPRNTTKQSKSKTTKLKNKKH